MDVILHLGAHRTGSTSFQQYMTQSCSDGVAFWGPRQTRSGLLDGVQGGVLPVLPKRARGRIAVQLDKIAATGAKTLVISDENMTGSLRSSMRCATLLPEAGMRMARVYAAFGGRITRVVLQIRAFDSYWASVLAFGLTRGIVRPNVEMRQRLVAGARSWRDVIADLACALPGVEITVTPFERFVQRPDQLLEVMTGTTARKMPPNGIWTNRSPEPRQLRRLLADTDLPDPDQLFDGHGRWQPFTPTQRQMLRARMSSDLTWLRSGADGMAVFHEHLSPNLAARAGPVIATTRGSTDNDSQERHMARPC